MDQNTDSIEESKEMLTLNLKPYEDQNLLGNNDESGSSSSIDAEE